MSIETTCPRCKHVLRVPAGVAGRWLTCPRCLSSVGNPHELLTDEPARPAAPVEEPRQTTCPECGREVDSQWRVCPYCEEPLREERRGLTVPQLDRDIRRESSAGGVVAIVLGVVLTFGMVCFLAVGGPALIMNGPEGSMVLVIGAGVVTAVGVGCIVLALNSRSKAGGTASGVVGGILTGAGAVGCVVLFACLSILAAVQNFFNACKCH
jgi:hypothetical protein